MRPIDDLERAIVAAMVAPTFPDVTDDEVAFVVLKWRNLPGIYSADVEMEPELSWLLDRHPTPPAPPELRS